MAEHSNVMGGSTAARRINCPGSYQLEEKAPKSTSEFADRGSMLHAAMELIMNEDPKNMKAAQPLFDQLEGQNMGFPGHVITPDLIATKLEPALKAWWEIDKKYKIKEIFIEQRVSLEKVVPGAFGTSDIFGRDEAGRLHVIDWKFGDGVPVPVENNLGMGFYACGVLYDEDDPEINDFCQSLPPVEESLEVVLHIVQPREGFDECLFTWETDDKWLDSVMSAIEAAAKKMFLDEPPTATGDWCKFCSAKVFCPEYQKLTVAVKGKEPANMTSTELAEYLLKAELLDGWVKDLWKFAQEQAEQGVQIPGYKLVQKRAMRKWDDDAEVEEICKKARVKVDAMYNKQLKSPAQMEKSAKNVFKKKLESKVTKVSSGVTLVSDTDTRPAVSGSMQLLAGELGKIDRKQETGNE